MRRSWDELEPIEDEATSILVNVPDYIWNGEELPVPVEEIVDSMYGLRVRDVEDMSSAPGAPEVGAGNISGLLLTGPGEIWVNADESMRWPTRRRFTIGHELGHWVLHRTGEQGLFCRTTQVRAQAEQLRLGVLEEAEEKKPSPKIPVPEEEANAFAAALLMPAHLISGNWKRSRADIGRMCEIFNCSEKAMTRRVESVMGFG